jgi:hypothetical protein
MDPKPPVSYRSRDRIAGGHKFDDKGKPLPVGSAFIRQLKEMPDFSNEITKATEAKLGQFVFDKEDSHRSGELIDKGPYEMDNGAVYHG